MQGLGPREMELERTREVFRTPVKLRLRMILIDERNHSVNKKLKNINNNNNNNNI